MKRRVSGPVVLRCICPLAALMVPIYILITEQTCIQLSCSELRPDADNDGSRILNFVSYYNSKYCLLHNFWAADVTDVEQITLVVHCSPEFIHYIPKQIQNWDGPISVAVQIIPPVYESDGFRIPSPSFMCLINNLHTMKQMDNRRYVSLHLFFEQLDDSPCPTIHLNRLEKEEFCSSKQGNTSQRVYPINVARNIARLGSKTKLFLSNDIENIMVPNYEPRMRKLAVELLLRRKQKTVLVHRRFELSGYLTSIPRTKKELEKLYKRKQAVQFHKYVFREGHYIPDIKEWFRKQENFTSATVAKEYQYLSGEWEPQFVADTSVPLHDERFPLRMRSNTHLGTVLCRQGYTFTVVNDLFSIHRGIKRREKRKDRYLKKLAIERGYEKALKQFRTMLDEMYPETKDQCPFPMLN